MKAKSDLQIFLAHAKEDKPQVRKLYQKLQAAGYRPWMDEEDLLPGQNWQDEITRTLRTSDFFLACLTQHSVTKRGYVQRELREALDLCADLPEGTIYLIPLKFEECKIPDLKQREHGLSLRNYHKVDYWKPNGFEKLIEAIELQRSSMLKESEHSTIQSGNSTRPNFTDNPGLSVKILKAISQTNNIFFLSGIVITALLFISNFPPFKVAIDDQNIPKSTEGPVLPSEQDEEKLIMTIGQEEILNIPKEAQNSNFRKGIHSFEEALKARGAQYTKKLENAKEKFSNSLDEIHKIPTALIFKNNAEALIYQQKLPSKVYFIAVPIPTEEEIVAKNIVRGVAVAQDEFNKNNDKRIIIILTFDKSDEVTSEKIATKLSEMNTLSDLDTVEHKFNENVVNLIGVVGHRSSTSSEAAIKIYDRDKIQIPIITPTSSSTKLDEYALFFRVVASNQDIANLFSRYIKATKRCSGKNVIVYDENDRYSIDLFESFKRNKDYNYGFMKFSQTENNGESSENELDRLLQFFPKPSLESELRNCVILAPGVNQVQAGFDLINEYNNLSASQNKPKIQFLGTSSFHNSGRLESNPSVAEGLIVEVPEPLFDKPSKDNSEYYHWVDDPNAGWRTHTSYLATFYFTKGIQKLESDITLEDQRKKIQENIDDELSGQKEKESKNVCLKTLDSKRKLTDEIVGFCSLEQVKGNN